MPLESDACYLSDKVIRWIEHPRFTDWVLKIDAKQKLSWVKKTDS